MKRTSVLIVGTSLVLVVAGILAWNGVQSGPAARSDAAEIARGSAIYVEHCAACHGENLEGQPDWRSRRPDGRLPAPPHDETGHTWHHPDTVLLGIIAEGPGAFVPGDYESDMPGFSGVLSAEEMQAVLTFIKSTWPPEIQARQRSISQRWAGADR